MYEPKEPKFWQVLIIALCCFLIVPLLVMLPIIIWNNSDYLAGKE